MSDKIYVLTNPAFPDHVKIGKTKNVERRVKELSRHSGVPEPFEIYYACEVTDAAKVEKHILAALGDYRKNMNREFLKIEPDKLKLILQLVELKDVTPKVVSEEDDELNSPPLTSVSKSKANNNQKKKRPRSAFTFSSAKIPVGSKLNFVSDEKVTAVVHDDRKVKFKGQIKSLTQSACDVLNKKHGRKKYKTLQGTLYWKYKNEILSERRLRFENIETPVKKEINYKYIFTFSSANIPIGSKLHFARDEKVTAIVHDDRRVKFDGKITSLTQSARDVLVRKFGWKKNAALTGTNYWKYENELLAKRRKRLEKSERPAKKR